MVVKIKRGTAAGFSSVSLQDGELAFLTDTKEIYVGYSGAKYNLTNPVVTTLHQTGGVWNTGTSSFTINTTGYRWLQVELSNVGINDCKGSILIPVGALPTSGSKSYRFPYDGSYVTVEFTYSAGYYGVKRLDTNSTITYRTFRGIR